MRQPITHFSGVTVDGTSDPERRRVVVAIVDDRVAGVRMGRKLARNAALAALEKVLDHAEDGALWSIVRVRASVETLVPFTTDQHAIRAGIEEIRHGVDAPKEAKTFETPFDPNDDFECETAECLMRQYDKLDDFSAQMIAALLLEIRRVGLMPGSRSVIVVAPGATSLTGDLADAIVRRASAASTRVYVVDPDIAGFGDSMFWIARATGGMYIRSNRPAESFDRFTRATTSFYELAFRTEPDDGRYHRIEVRLLRPGRFTILHRDGYVRIGRR